MVRAAKALAPESRTAVADRDRPQRRNGPLAHIPAQEALMVSVVVAVRHDRRTALTKPEEATFEALTHLTLAITRYVRQLRKEGLPVPSMVEELAVFLTMYVRTRQAATGVHRDYGTLQDVPVVRRLLITKADAAEQLGISVRTVHRLIAAGKLPLVHVEGAARLRVADLEAYVDSLVPQDTAQSDGEDDINP
jgi:excisionase family DNA binding protein